VEKKAGDCRSGTYWLGIHKHAHCTSYVARPCALTHEPVVTRR